MTAELWKRRYLLEIGFNIILCGDFNIVTEATDRISKVEFRELRESKLLVKVCKEAALRDLYRHLHPHTVHYTRFDSLTKTRIDRFYISHNVQGLKYDTLLTDFSDHMVVMATLLVSEVKSEIRKILHLKILTTSFSELWELLKRRVCQFFKFKARELNHAKNVKYNEDVSRYIYLRNKKEKEEKEENQMMSLKEDIDRVNREVLFNMLRRTDFHGNSDYMILNNQKKCRNDFIVSIKDKHGKETMGKSFYEGVMCLLYKKGDREDINNYRQLTIMNVDYKIFSKIIMSRLEDVLDIIIEKEQTCAIKGRLMWDNLSMLREIIYNGKDSELCILGLDQRRAFDSVSHSYLWKVMKAYNFPDQFISIIQLSYKKSLVQVKVNGKLSSPFSAEYGVKQGCPLSAALYVLAINPLLKRINDDKRIKGYVLDKSFKITALGYADDVTVIIRNQNELSSVMEILHHYEQASGAKLNQDKTEGVWLGLQTRQPKMMISLCREIKILGIWIDNTDSSLLNWNKKENEIKMEIMKWENKDTNYKTRINIVKTHIISKLLFLAAVFPPPRTTVMKISKIMQIKLKTFQ
uniref:Reverse transcriptase domain-containing protein n=1 Tax=Astatotilapia calliptera TaxID=8154 RepID=A0AAX7UBY7_ASTCA